ncbi:hypothetical protein DYQ86_12000 [Acidobacteria bacterium AB60]|nr:hypothetical protein DYQ86_12000 [Acidobacteria bacterium AB60]
MALTGPNSFPPVTAEFTGEVQRAEAGAAAAQSAYRLTRAADGNTRLDSGETSVISNPAAGHSVVLNHAAKTAIVQPHPPALPAVPGMPVMPSAPGGAALATVQDLGKSVFQGTPVEGKRYVFQPPAMPAPPAAPKAPALPKTPDAPKPPAGMAPGSQPPGAPAAQAAALAPPAPPTPTVAEVWTSPKLGLPMFTKMNGGFGQITHVCQSATPGEPHPAAFQIPPDYKVMQPEPPTTFESTQSDRGRG